MFPDRDRFEWFEAHAEAVIERCRRVTRLPGVSEVPVGIYVPGGDDKYPSFWIRDYAMQCHSGFIASDEMKASLLFFLSLQNGEQKRDLANGLKVDPWALPDHINVPGVGNDDFHKTYADGPVFFPGSYSPGDDQGKGRYGFRPADDDIYEVVDLARLVIKSMPDTQPADLLESDVDGASVIERLHCGMMAMTVDSATGLCLNTPDNWSASNFHDALKPMGLISVTSCLRFRASETMAEFFGILGKPEQVEHYRHQCERIAASVVSELMMPSGWLIVGTKLDRQPDVWATSMAVYYGVLKGEHADKACQAMLDAYNDGSVATSGYLRHTPTTADAIPGEKVWEDDSYEDPSRYGVYQNGGYWPQIVGYYASALHRVDQDAARRIACEFIDHTRTRAKEGAPFEWINPALGKEDCRWYGPSAALPLEGFRRLSKTQSGA